MRSNSFQDILFLAGIIVLSSILIIGLFPGRFDAGLVDENFFITTVMTVPVIAAIYFIIISFRRRLNIKSRDIRESLSKKLTISFLFIAVLSTMPIVIVSSTYFNQNLSMMFRGSTGQSIRESIKLSGEIVGEFSQELRNELESIEYYIRNNKIYSFIPAKEQVYNSIGKKGFSFLLFKTGPVKATYNYSLPGNDYSEEMRRFYGDLKEGAILTDRIVIHGKNILSGAVKVFNMVFVLTREVPLQLGERENLFYKADSEYREAENIRNYFVKGSGAFLMILSMVIVGLAYFISHYLSQSITKPLVELSNASVEVSRGNYDATVSRKSEDEIGLLVSSFNNMSQELKRNKKVMFQKQKLEAWNDMARKLVHEIKNPLTPIRLSAERIRRLVQSKKENIEESVITGTDTIISEVDSLLKLVVEFNNFARLPEKHAEKNDLYRLLEDTVSFFAVYENVSLSLVKDSDTKEIFFDRVLIKQALNNIISNAIQAMNENGEINIRAEQCSPEMVQVAIRDNGPGIREEDLDKIFEPGFTLKKDGSGLGLAIVRKIILEHSGKVSCTSETGKGTEFFIYLPAILEKKDV